LHKYRARKRTKDIKKKKLNIKSPEKQNEEADKRRDVSFDKESTNLTILNSTDTLDNTIKTKRSFIESIVKPVSLLLNNTINGINTILSLSTTIFFRLILLTSLSITSIVILLIILHTIASMDTPISTSINDFLLSIPKTLSDILVNLFTETIKQKEEPISQIEVITPDVIQITLEYSFTNLINILGLTSLGLIIIAIFTLSVYLLYYLGMWVWNTIIILKNKTIQYLNNIGEFIVQWLRSFDDDDGSSAGSRSIPGSIPGSRASSRETSGSGGIPIYKKKPLSTDEFIKQLVQRPLIVYFGVYGPLNVFVAEFNGVTGLLIQDSFLHLWVFNSVLTEEKFMNELTNLLYDPLCSEVVCEVPPKEEPIVEQQQKKSLLFGTIVCIAYLIVGLALPEVGAIYDIIR
jgi:hypothetical protein